VLLPPVRPLGPRTEPLPVRFAIACGFALAMASGIMACGALLGLGPPPETDADAGPDAPEPPGPGTLDGGDAHLAADAEAGAIEAGGDTSAPDSAPESGGECGAPAPPTGPDAGATVTFDGGVTVFFLPLPTVAVTGGLATSQITPNAGFYLGGGMPMDFAAISPFSYSATLDGSVYAAILGGSATYSYGAPKASLGVLWGTIDPSNDLRLLAPKTGVVVAALAGGVLASAAGDALGAGYSYANGANVVVIPPAPFDTAIFTGGDDHAVFEYSNLVVTPVCGP
jgi:hypothetical protein